MVAWGQRTAASPPSRRAPSSGRRAGRRACVALPCKLASAVHRNASAAAVAGKAAAARNTSLVEKGCHVGSLLLLGLLRQRRRFQLRALLDVRQLRCPTRTVSRQTHAAVRKAPPTSQLRDDAVVLGNARLLGRHLLVQRQLQRLSVLLCLRATPTPWSLHARCHGAPPWSAPAQFWPAAPAGTPPLPLPAPPSCAAAPLFAPAAPPGHRGTRARRTCGLNSVRPAGLLNRHRASGEGLACKHALAWQTRVQQTSTQQTSTQHTSAADERAADERAAEKCSRSAL